MQDRHAKHEPTRHPMAAAVIGIEHPHIFSMASNLVAAGAKLTAYEASPASPWLDAFAKAFPDARAVVDRGEILESSEIAVVLGAGVPCDRAEIGIEVMRHGKDYLVDKAGVTSAGQLERVRQVQRETSQKFTVVFSERVESRASERTSELVASGAIGRVLQTIGLGPHRLSASARPAWFFEKARYGGILTDLASHQADQFLHFSKATKARVVAARVANLGHPEHPELEDFGEMLLEGDGVSGYARVDWFTPDGLASWGDTRLTILGTEGSLELRKNVDLAGRPGGDHLFLVDAHETRHFDCSSTSLPFYPRFLDDVLTRGETAMSQAHCFRACELALAAQAFADDG